MCYKEGWLAIILSNSFGTFLGLESFFFCAETFLGLLLAEFVEDLLFGGMSTRG